jgi:hypothetical protein
LGAANGAVRLQPDCCETSGTGGVLAMSGQLSIPRTAAWVWHCGPRPIFGLDAVFVRCASGTSRACDDFDYASNFKRWASARGPSVIPWTWLGPPASLDGLGAADLLCDIAPGRSLYLAELQFELPGEEVANFARRVRQREPDALLGFSSLPTRAEADAAGVPWDACVEQFDLGLPQVYTPAQRELLMRNPSPVVDDMGGKPIHVATFPDSDVGWLETARVGISRHAGASAWSVDQSSFASWRRQLSNLAADEDRLKRPASQRTPVEEALLANRIIAIVQAHLDAGGRVDDERLLTGLERALRDGTA